MTDLVGQRLENYRVDKLLGEGGMGAVYQAYDVNLARIVALKVMHRQLASQPEFQRRFLQEAQAAARLGDHANIVNIYNFGGRQGLFYMVMEFVDGSSLGAYIKHAQRKNQVVKLSETLQILAQVSEALGYAHRQGVVHRDVKPDNVLLKKLDEPDKDSGLPIRAVVTDFGLAKLLEGGMQTQTGTFMGTLPYMSPEQCLNKELDGRSDIYSLGILLFQLATGQLPFDVRTPTDAVLKHINELPPPPRSIRPGVPASVEEIITKAIAKDPAERFATGEAMATALRQATSGLTEADVTRFAPPRTVVSLATQLMPAGQVPEPSQLGYDITAMPGQARLLIARQGQAPRAYPLDKEMLTIGRSNDNDLVLAAEGVSRQHARLQRDAAGGWHIVDLASTNGSFLEENRLLPDLPEAWEPGQTLRIGPFFLRLQLGEGQVPGRVPGSFVPTFQPTARARAPIGGTQVYSSTGQLSVVVQPTNVVVDPGSRADVQVELLNQGTTVDHFNLQVEELPREWITVPQQSVHLMPGANGSLPLAIHPPLDSSSTAGQHPYRIVVSSTSDQKESASVSAQVTVNPFQRFSADMRPVRLRHGGTCRVLVRNEGNAKASYSVVGRDPAEGIRFEQKKGRLGLAPGDRGTVDLRLTAKQRPFLGRSRPMPFEVQVATAGGDQRALSGELEVRPVLPPWVLPLLGVLSLILCLSAVGLYSFFSGRNEEATQTAEALAEGQLAVEMTREAEQTIAAEATTRASEADAGTATSAAQTAEAEGDADGDGLSNNRELALGTDPNNPDTDGDGLNDGQEVNQHGTEPTKRDSDNDTLSDGDEINTHNTSPTNPDTDNDGVPDGVEISNGTDPRLPPTATASPSHTPSATATLSPSSTPSPTSLPTFTPTLEPTPTATPTSPPPIQSWDHAVDLLNNRTIYYVRLTGPGLITINASWTGDQGSLAIIVNGPGQTGFYVRQDGPSPLQASYNVTPGDFAAGDTWRVTIASFGNGRADGTVTISYLSGATSGPFVDDFAVQPSSGKIVNVLVLRGSGTVSGEATWSGTPSNLALIINGPGQVGFYAREDGSSPLSASYNVTPADFSAGDYWRVSLVAFSQANINSADISLIYP